MVDKNPTMSQAVADQQPAGDDMSLRDIFKSMKKAPDGRGMSGLGYDGVLRAFDTDRNVLDAVGLNPAQIREYYQGLPLPERFLAADGRNVSHWNMFHPEAENIPKKYTEEEKAAILAHNEELQRRGVTGCGLGKTTDEAGSNGR